jgi:hypothetical protein
MLKFLQATNITWSDSTATSVSENCPVIYIYIYTVISAHKLNIEVGRYNKTPRNERFCKKCNTDEIEDEMHFLLLCNHFETERKNILVAGENNFFLNE